MTSPNDRSKKWTDEKRDRVRDLAAQGLSAAEIADDFADGTTRNSVIGQCFRHGIQLLGKPYRAAPSEQPKPDVPPKHQRAKKANLGRQLPIKKTPTKPAQNISEPEPPIVAPPKGGLTLLELNGRTCRWPIGHPDDPGFRFCGAPDANIHETPRRPYCRAHARIAYRSGTAGKRRAVRDAERIEL